MGYNTIQLSAVVCMHFSSSPTSNHGIGNSTENTCSLQENIIEQYKAYLTQKKQCSWGLQLWEQNLRNELHWNHVLPFQHQLGQMWQLAHQLWIDKLSDRKPNLRGGLTFLAHFRTVSDLKLKVGHITLEYVPCECCYTLHHIHLNVTWLGLKQNPNSLLKVISSTTSWECWICSGSWSNPSIKTLQWEHLCTDKFNGWQRLYGTPHNCPRLVILAILLNTSFETNATKYSRQ